jgi:hypothetical protein
MLRRNIVARIFEATWATDHTDPSTMEQEQADAASRGEPPRLRIYPVFQ